MNFLSLQERGIASSASHAGWHPQAYKSHAGWAYPIHDPITEKVIATRWKSAESGGMKYAWIPSKPDSPASDWYVLPKTILAIQQADGTAYLANGEPALLAYHSANVSNVIATTLSEVGIPKSLIATLKALGISRLLYPVDNDSAGEKSAIKWRDVLRESGVDFQTFSWGADAPAKADANDIWIQVGFDAVAFQKRLAQLEPLSLPLPEPKLPPIDEADFEQTPQGLIDILASRLGVTGWKSNGWASKNISSPFRDERHPSATFNRESGVLHDFGTGESYSPTQVAEQLGIDWKAFYPKRNISTKAPRPRLDAITNTSVTSVTIPPFEADKIVDMRYISDIDLGELGDTNLIRSPLATGKTSLISKIIANANDNAKILVITHLQALAENISERLSQELDKPVECYHHIPHEYRPSAYRLVCSYDSLHTIRDDWDYIFIDEHEQFHRHLTSGTMRGNEPVRAYKKLLTIIEGAQHLTVMDAHMSVASTHFLKFFRGKLNRIKNTYRHKWQTMTFHQKESKVLAEAFKEASKDSTHGVVIPTNSRSKSQDYYQLACETFGNDAVMLINGENSSSKDVRQFIRQLTDPHNKNKSLAEIFPNLRILICSPSLATGLDVQARVSGVYGIFTQQKWVNACNIMQMMMRYRNADDRQLCVMGSNLIPEPRTNPEDFVDSEYFAMNTRLDGTTVAADFGKHGVPFSNYMQEHIAIFSAWFEYETHYQQQSLRYFTELSAQDEGFTVAYQEGEDVIIREQLKWAREQRAEAFKQAVLSETVVSPDEFDVLRQHPDTTSEQLRKATAGLERWHIEFISGQTVTSQLFAHLGSTRKRADFNRLLDLLDNVENLKKRDRDEAINDILVIKRKHYTRNRDLIYMAGRCVFGEDWLTNEQQATADTITEKLEAYMRLYIEEIRQYIDRRLDLSSKALNVFRRLLKRIGLRLGRAQVMVDGERFYMYFIDGEHREEMLAIATIGLQARDLRELLQTRTTLINIREWSKQQSDDSVYERWQAQFADIPI